MYPQLLPCLFSSLPASTAPFKGRSLGQARGEPEPQDILAPDSFCKRIKTAQNKIVGPWSWPRHKVKVDSEKGISWKEQGTARPGGSHIVGRISEEAGGREGAP